MININPVYHLGNPRLLKLGSVLSQDVFMWERSHLHTCGYARIC